MRRALRFVAVLLALVAAFPLALTVLYAVVNPPSVPLLRHALAGTTAEHRWVPLGEIAPALPRAVIMAEDARFCLHYGVDLSQAMIVLGDVMDGEAPRGASTITMQTVKNLFLWSDRSYVRKALELPLALWFDLVLSKDRILEIYLNVAQWGPRQYGVEAAAQHFFGRSADGLSRSQAMALATMLPAPAVRDPRRPGPRQRGVIAHVERELARAPWVFSCLAAPIRP